MTQSGNEDRSLTARSIVASALLGTHPPTLPGRVLVRLGELFGVAEGTTRVALSRMVSAGELTTDDARYALASPELLARQAAQQQGRRLPALDWYGDWVLAIVTAGGRDASTRAALRAAAASLRLAELREGVWMRPANLEWGRDGAQATLTEQCTVMTARPEDGAELAARLWPLDEWAVTARRLVARMEQTSASLDSGSFDAIPEGFVTSAAVLRLLRSDPLLPDDLLPRRWPGRDLRARYDGYDAALRRLLRAFFAASRTRTQPGSASTSSDRPVTRA